MSIGQSATSRTASAVSLLSGNRYRLSFTGRDFSFLGPGAAVVSVAGPAATGATATQAKRRE